MTIFKTFIESLRETWRRLEIEALNKEIEACTAARAKLKAQAARAQAKRDALIGG